MLCYVINRDNISYLINLGWAAKTNKVKTNLLRPTEFLII